MSVNRKVRSGHTLVEMVVVGTILALVATFSARAWGPIGGSIVGLRDRAVGAAELRVAVAWLLSDLGAADRVEKHDDVLRIRREAAAVRTLVGAGGDEDRGLEYSVRDGLLRRKDRLTGEEFVVARAVREFQLRPSGAHDLRISLTAGQEEDLRTITLLWHG